MSTAASTRPAPNPWWVATVSGMASYIDAAAIVSFGIVITIYAAVLGFTTTEVGIGSGALTLGIAVGAIFGGKLGDRFGRRPVFSITMVVILIGVVLAVLATSFPLFLVGAVLVGLGTGGDLPVSLSTISEAGTDANRGKLVSLSNILWLAGIIAAMVGGMTLGNLGRLGAQLLLGHLGVVALLVLVGRFTIPESPVWLAAQEERRSGVRTVRADKGSVRDLFGPRYRAPFLALIIFYALVNLAANTAGQFSTYLLVNVAKVDVSAASSLGLIAIPIGLIGYLWFMRIADGTHRFVYFTVGAALYVVAQLVPAIFGYTATTFLVSNIIGAFGTAFAFETIMKVWSQESFPTLLRTTAQGTIIAVARFSAAILATLTPLLLQAGVTVLYGFLAVVSAIGFLVAWIVFRTHDRINEFDTEDEIDRSLDIRVEDPAAGPVAG